MTEHPGDEIEMYFSDDELLSKNKTDSVDKNHKDEKPKFFVKEGSTYVRMKESVVLFADFAMKVVGEIWPKGKGENTVIGIAKGQEGQWLMSCTGHSFSKKETRQIALPVDAFDSKQRLLTALRNSFPCGTLNLTCVATNSLVNQYWEQLRITYLKNVNEGISTRICYLTDHHGWQSGKYWLLSSQTHLDHNRILSPLEITYFPERDISAYSTEFNSNLTRRLYFQNVMRKYLDLSCLFKTNELVFKMATSFVVARLVRTKDATKWEESNLGLLYSSVRNVGKSLTLDILSKAQGVQSRNHPLILSGGNQITAGTSDKKILETLASTTMVVMVDDPTFSDSLGEFLLQVQSGLTQGSSGTGMLVPKGSLLLSSNNKEVERVKGRVIRFEYVKDQLTPEELESQREQELKELVEGNKGLLVAWVLHFEDIWEHLKEPHIKDIMSALFLALPKHEPRWIKGVAYVIYAYCLIHSTVGIQPEVGSMYKYLVETEEEEIRILPILTRIQVGLYRLIRKDTNKVLTFINPNASVRRIKAGKLLPAIAVKITMIDEIDDVEKNEVRDYVGGDELGFSQVSLLARNEEATLTDLRKKTDATKIVNAKVFKITKSALDKKFMDWVDYATSKSENTPPDDYNPGENIASEDHPKNSSGNLRDVAHNLHMAVQEYLAKTAAESVEDDAEEMDICSNLSPLSKTEYKTWTPKRKRAFTMGVKAERRNKITKEVGTSPVRQALPEDVKSAKCDTEKVNSGISAQTSSPSCSSSADIHKRSAARKELFPEGAIGIIQTTGPKVTRNVEKCPCGKKEGKSKSKKQRWIQCDTCKQWLHLECSGEVVVPEGEWYCKQCKSTCNAKEDE